MKPNVGNLDRVLRIVAGLTLLGLGYYFQNPLGLIGLVPITTGLTRRCPAYYPFGLCTLKDSEK